MKPHRRTRLIAIGLVLIAAFAAISVWWSRSVRIPTIPELTLSQQQRLADFHAQPPADTASAQAIVALVDALRVAAAADRPWAADRYWSSDNHLPPDDDADWQDVLAHLEEVRRHIGSGHWRTPTDGLQDHEWPSALLRTSRLMAWVASHEDTPRALTQAQDIDRFGREITEGGNFMMNMVGLSVSACGLQVMRHRIAEITTDIEPDTVEQLSAISRRPVPDLDALFDASMQAEAAHVWAALEDPEADWLADTDDPQQLQQSLRNFMGHVLLAHGDPPDPTSQSIIEPYRNLDPEDQFIIGDGGIFRLSASNLLHLADNVRQQISTAAHHQQASVISARLKLAQLDGETLAPTNLPPELATWAGMDIPVSWQVDPNGTFIIDPPEPAASEKDPQRNIQWTVPDTWQIPAATH